MRSDEGIEGQIRSILLHTWDPQNLRDNPERQDAYDRFLAQAAEWLHMGMKQPQIEQELFRVETLTLQLENGDQARRKEASRMLANLGEAM